MDFGCILGALGVILGGILVVFWTHSGTYVGECWGMLGDARGCWGMLGNAVECCGMPINTIIFFCLSYFLHFKYRYNTLRACSSSINHCRMF